MTGYLPMTSTLRSRTQPSVWMGIALAAALVLAACSSADVTPESETSASTAGESATPDTAVATESASESDSTPFTPTTTDDQVEAAVDVFIAAPTSANAASLVETIEGNRSERWVPWLLDLLRVDISLSVSNSISDTLEQMTGVESTARIPDMIAFGGWSQTRGLDGGAGYIDFKATLYERIDDEFGPLIRSVADPVEAAAIQWGGVPLGGIPELNDPARVTAVEADWMVDDEIVLGVVNNGEAVAYPLRIVARHELANDNVGGEDLAIVYCTLCRSALVFERDVDGQRLDFLTSGLLLNSNKIMYDPQTETLWSHQRGIGIGGELLGTELVLRSVNHMRWGDWVAENPYTHVLAIPEHIFFDDPERPPISYDYAPGVAYESYYNDEELWFPVLDAPDTFDLKTEVVGIENNGDAVAFDVQAFNDIGETQTIEVGGVELTVEPTGAGVRVFNPDGERLITNQIFWFSWFANNPETRTIEF